MIIEIRKAERAKSKLRLGLAGPAGSGKTMSALKLAKGLGNKICLIDTENGSGDLYANLFEYDLITLNAPNYAPKNYIEAIHAAENAGYEVIIIDSLSHAWVGVGGLLDQVDKKAGNSFTAWRDITPQHNQLVDAMLTSTKHIIATMRSKTEYGTDTDKNGKMVVKKMGLAPVQREGMDYEFTVMMDINQDHYATVSKDRTNMFRDEVFMIDEKIGERLKEWLGQGVDRELLENKKKITSLMKMLDKPADEAPEAFIGRTAKLPLVAENYGEIVNRLEVLVMEHKQAKKEQEFANSVKPAETAPVVPATEATNHGQSIK